ncbi:MAG: hypothetical protein JWO63_1682, partial [Frankiales bacterium]|nr:hypothetical protein [Frankiales bacterium]
GATEWQIAAETAPDGAARTHLNHPPRRLNPAPWDPDPPLDWSRPGSDTAADFPDEPPF